MTVCLRLFTALCLAALLAACASSPSSSLGELPRTPDASLEQLLQQASQTQNPEKAALLRLSAADLGEFNPGHRRQVFVLQEQHAVLSQPGVLFVIQTIEDAQVLAHLMPGLRGDRVLGKYPLASPFAQ